QTGPVEEEDLQGRPPLPEEEEERAAPRIATEPIRDEPGETIEAPSKIDRLESDEDLHAVRDHRAAPRVRSRASSTSSTAPSASRSKPDSTRTKAVPTTMARAPAPRG